MHGTERLYALGVVLENSLSVDGKLEDNTLKNMKVIVRYFRQHPWQRRVVTGSMAVILGVILAWIIWPSVRDRSIIELLGSEDPNKRMRGIVQAVAVGKVCPELVQRIERKLDSADDVQFSAMVEVLNRLGLFDVPGRRGYQIDRYRQITFATSRTNPTGTDVKRLMLHGIILDGRDNKYVRKTLQLALHDAVADIRSQAAILAARLKDSAALKRLLGDVDPAVRASSAIDAGLAGLKDCSDAMWRLLKGAQDDEEIAAVAYGLSRLEPNRLSQEIVEKIKEARERANSALLGKLLYVASLLKDKSTEETVAKMLEESLQEKKSPALMAIIAAGRIKPVTSKNTIKRIIDDIIARRAEFTFADASALTAAVKAGDEVGLPADLFVDVMEQLWHPATTLAMIFSAEALARRQGSFTAEQRDKVLKVLNEAVNRTDTPVASAAAAVAIFRIAPAEAIESLRTACESENCLAGDYVAWNLAQSDSREVWTIAKSFLAPDEYNSSVKSVGAMLIASLARRSGPAQQVAEGIKSRLEQSPYIDQAAPFLAGTYRCALLMLTREEYRDVVIALLQSRGFPKFRAIWALVAAGEPMGFDMVFAETRFRPSEIDFYLGRSLVYMLYSKVIPQMPVYDVQAPLVVRYWQCRLCRDYYLIHRATIISRISQ